MRELQMADEVNFVGRAGTADCRAPFAHAIECENGCLFKWAWKKCAGCMTFVVIGEDKARLSRIVQLVTQDTTHVKFFLEPQRHSHGKTFPTTRCKGDIGFEQTVKLGERLFVEHDVIQVVWLQATFAQTGGNCPGGKSCIVLPPREALFLCRGDDFTIDDERRCAVMIKSRDAKNGGHR